MFSYLAKPRWYFRSPNPSSLSKNSPAIITWGCIAYPRAKVSCWTKSASSEQWVALPGEVPIEMNHNWEGRLESLYMFAIPATRENFRMQYSCMCDNEHHTPTCSTRQLVFQSMPLKILLIISSIN